MILVTDWEAVARELARMIVVPVSVYDRIVRRNSEERACPFCLHPACDGTTHKAYRK